MLFETILEQILKEEKVTYDVYDRQIVIRKAESVLSVEPKKKSVTGKQLMPTGCQFRVSVVLKGTTNGTVSDSNGNYTIFNVPENSVLQFSFMGMKTQEVEAAKRRSTFPGRRCS